MAIDLSGAATTRLDVGSAGVLDNVSIGNLLLWVYPLNTAAQSVIWSKNWTATNTGQRMTQNASGMPRWFLQRATQNMVGLPDAAGGPYTYGQDKWCFLCVQWDLAGTVKLYHGDLTTAAVEYAAYTTQQVGSGAQTDDSAGSGILGNDSLAASDWQGYMAYFGHVSTRLLSLAEIRLWQARPGNLLNMVDFRDLKSTAAADLVDRLGNNSATLTGGADVAGPNLGPYLRGQRENVSSAPSLLRAAAPRRRRRLGRSGTLVFESLQMGWVSGTAAVTLGSLTVAAAATLKNAGTASATLGALSTTASGTLAAAASAAVSLATLTAAASATLIDPGTATATLALSASGTATVINASTATLSLPALGVVADGAVQNAGAAALTLGALTTDAAASFTVHVQFRFTVPSGSRSIPMQAGPSAPCRFRAGAATCRLTPTT